MKGKILWREKENKRKIQKVRLVYPGDIYYNSPVFFMAALGGLIPTRTKIQKYRLAL
jgi:hypothetical protein